MRLRPDLCPHSLLTNCYYMLLWQNCSLHTPKNPPSLFSKETVMKLFVYCVSVCMVGIASAEDQPTKETIPKTEHAATTAKEGAECGEWECTELKKEIALLKEEQFKSLPEGYKHAFTQLFALVEQKEKAAKVAFTAAEKDYKSAYKEPSHDKAQAHLKNAAIRFGVAQNEYDTAYIILEQCQNILEKVPPPPKKEVVKNQDIL